MTTLTDLDKIVSIKEDLHDAIEEKGVEVPSTTAFEEYPNKVRAISTGSNFDVDDVTIEKYTEAGTSLTKIRVKDGGLSEDKLNTDLKTKLNNKADKSEIPTKTSQLTNDSGYITSAESYNKTEIDNKLSLKADISSLSNYATKADLTAKADKTDLNNYHTKTEMSVLLANKADKASTLEGYGIYDAYTKTEINLSMNLKADKTELPTKVSQLENDAGYIKEGDFYTKAQTDAKLLLKADKTDLDNYATKTELSLKADSSTLVNYATKVALNFVENQVNTNTTDIAIIKTDIDSLTTTVSKKANSDDVYSKTKVDEKLDLKADKTDIPVIPTKVSAFENDAGYITNADIYTKEQTDALLDNKADKSTLNNYALKTDLSVKADKTYVDSELTLKANKTDLDLKADKTELLNYATKTDLNTYAKKDDLNDYALRTELDNYNTKSEISNLLYLKADKTQLDSLATKTEVALKADKADTLYGYGITDAYTKSQIDEKVSGALHYKGSVETYEDLPTTGQKVGDVYNIINEHKTEPKFPAGTNVAWNGDDWDILGGTVDLSAYAKTEYVNAQLLLKADKTQLDNYYTKTESDSKLDLKADKTQLADYYTKTESDTKLDLKADKTQLDDYYKKTETYNQQEIDNFIELRKTAIVDVIEYGFDENLRVDQVIEDRQLVDAVLLYYETDKRFVVVKAGDFKYSVMGIVHADGIRGFTAQGQIIDPTKIGQEKPQKEQVLFLYIESVGKTYSIYTKDSKVAVSGCYNDLDDKPTKLSDFINDLNFTTKEEVAQLYYNKEYINNNYYTKTEVDNLLTTMQNKIDALEAKLNALEVDGELTDTKVKLILS